MATFAYRIKDKTGAVVSGTLEGDSRQIVLDKLAQMGFVLDLSEKKELFGSLKGIQLSQKRVKSKDMTIFSRQLATMINSGLPLIEALSILVDQTENSTLSSTTSKVRASIESGASLSAALGEHPKIFPSIYINVVRAGEASGMLDDVLIYLADGMEKDQAIKRKVKSAMTYPVVVFCFAMLVLTAMLIFIVPIFANMITKMGGKLPLITAIVIGASNIVRAYWWAIILGLVGLIFAWTRIKATKTGRLWIDRVKLRLPIFGNIFRKLALSRFTRTFGMLITAGVPLLQSLDIVAKAVGNVIYENAILETRASVKEGESIAKPLGEAGMFPPMVTQMIAVGESTGALSTMLKKISDFYDSEIDAIVSSLTALLEPVMIIFLGGVIGFIVISMYLPIFAVVTTLTK